MGWYIIFPNNFYLSSDFQWMEPVLLWQQWTL
jgi:hypothetical protein